ncbi:MAG TPA: TIGR00375 family protein [Methanobacterium sp.]|nr:TIGR00375 family protein [Methanobacterium sp.]
MIIKADLHIHGQYSMATSKKMNPYAMAPQAKLKGLDLVATGDALHGKYLENLKESLEESSEGIFSLKDDDTGVKFILTVEVEDLKRVHHLLLIPSYDAAYNMREELRGNLDSDGRPKVRMGGAEIMDIAHSQDCLIGPSHAFTPWTSIYKSYDSIMDCYNRKPDFLELGLSADTNMADHIKELQDIPFLTNSDAHSPWPHRLGREFNEMEVKDLTFGGVAQSILNKKITTNYGFDPRLGKYHKTACTKCYRIFPVEEALNKNMRCPCGGTIKKGVDYRIYELSTWDEPHHPPHRPPYIHLLPLAEILSLIYDKGVTTVFVQKIWKSLVEKFGNEIIVLIYASLDEIDDVDPLLTPVIKAFRDNTLPIQPGGGGKYGKIMLNPADEDIEIPSGYVNGTGTLDKYLNG